MVWSLALEGKNDHDRFKELGWGFCTWDKWEWNDCDKRFGDDWPGRIPAQMTAHILRCFSKPDDLIPDPMAGGGILIDDYFDILKKTGWYIPAALKSRLEKALPGMHH